MKFADHAAQVAVEMTRFLEATDRRAQRRHLKAAISHVARARVVARSDQAKAIAEAMDDVVERMADRFAEWDAKNQP